MPLASSMRGTMTENAEPAACSKDGTHCSKAAGMVPSWVR